MLKDLNDQDIADLTAFAAHAFWNQPQARREQLARDYPAADGPDALPAWKMELLHGDYTGSLQRYRSGTVTVEEFEDLPRNAALFLSRYGFDLGVLAAICTYARGSGIPLALLLGSVQAGMSAAEIRRFLLRRMWPDMESLEVLAALRGVRLCLRA